MEHFEEEYDDIIALNADMTAVVLDSGMVEPDVLTRCHRDIERIRMSGEKPPILLNYLLDQGFIENAQYGALEKATQRAVRERESSQYVLPGYKVINRIGGGGLGTVVLARQLSMKRLVAVKVLHDKWVKDVELRSRFLLEARVMGRLSHQHLVQVYDVGKEDSTYYFSMEYVDGQTLEQVMKKEGLMALSKILDITIQVARAIDYISKFEIVHRDIKPANIMMTTTGMVKLGDFGFLFSKHESRLNKDGYVVGTPDYISPEQASGHKVDFRSDLYSLGVCLYQMMTGLLPYEGTVSTVMRQHVVGELPERTPLGGREIPKEIYNIIIKLMVKDPHDRYSNMTELLEDLDYYRAAEVMKSDSRHRDRPLDIKEFKVDNELKDLKNETRLLHDQLKYFFYVIIGLLVFMVLETFFFIYMYG